MTESQDKKVIEVPNTGWDSRVRVFRVPHEIDTSVIVTERYLVFVDTMITPEQILAVRSMVEGQIAGRQVLVVNTHADYDHAWGNAVFESPGGQYPAPIIAGQATAARLRSAEERRYLEERQKLEPNLAHARLVPPTISFAGSCTIDGGDLSLVLLPTPGHTRDHMSVWLPEIRLLLAGDAAEHPYPYCGRDANIDILLDSLDTLGELRPVVVIPCHGGTTTPDLLDRNRAYFVTLDGLARSAIESGAVDTDWETASGIEETIGYTFEQSVRDQGSDPASIGDFYRNSHVLAIRATLRRVFGGSQAL